MCGHCSLLQAALVCHLSWPCSKEGRRWAAKWEINKDRRSVSDLEVAQSHDWGDWGRSGGSELRRRGREVSPRWEVEEEGRMVVLKQVWLPPWMFHNKRSIILDFMSLEIKWHPSNIAICYTRARDYYYCLKQHWLSFPIPVRVKWELYWFVSWSVLAWWWWLPCILTVVLSPATVQRKSKSQWQPPASSKGSVVTSSALLFLSRTGENSWI